MAVRVSTPSGPVAERSPRHTAGRKTSASGVGTVKYTYKPEPGDKSTKIVFIQVMREVLDDKVRKPSEIVPAFAFQDADTTANGLHVDYNSGEADPYYNGDDPKDKIAGNQQGDAAAKVDATASDMPVFGDADFPAGTSKLRWEFRTCAFSAAGTDAGRYYDFVDWEFRKEKGKASTTKIGKTEKYGPGKWWTDAIDLFNKNHAFAMPKYTP